jgi:hypothetical protein
MRANLCRPIELVEDGERLSRRNLPPLLGDQIGCNPAEDENKDLTDEEIANFRHRATADLERFRRGPRKIVASSCLDPIESEADNLTCCSDTGGPQNGRTAAEVSMVEPKGILIYVVAPVPVEQVSDRVPGCRGQVFSSVDGLGESLPACCSRQAKAQLSRLAVYFLMPSRCSEIRPGLHL